MDKSQRFSKDEVSEIVREALQLDRSDEYSMSYADLEDVARQCGVHPDTLERTLEKREMDAKKDAIRQRWRKKALAALAWPGFVCTCLVLLNVQTGGFPWAIFPVVFWLLPEWSRARKKLFPTDAFLTKTAQRMRAAHG